MNENFSEALIEKENGTLIKIEVIPNSSKSEIFTFNEWRKCIIVKIKEPAQKGKANKEIIQLFSSIFGISEISIISGQKSRNKTILVNMKTEEIIIKLNKVLK